MANDRAAVAAGLRAGARARDRRKPDAVSQPVRGAQYHLAADGPHGLERAARNPVHPGFPDAQAAHGPHRLPRAYSPETRSAVRYRASAAAHGALERSHSRRGSVLAARHARLGDTDRNSTGDRRNGCHAAAKRNGRTHRHADQGFEHPPDTVENDAAAAEYHVFLAQSAGQQPDRGRLRQHRPTGGAGRARRHQGGSRAGRRSHAGACARGTAHGAGRRCRADRRYAHQRPCGADPRRRKVSHNACARHRAGVHHAYGPRGKTAH